MAAIANTNVKGSVIVITGGSSGIGLAVARAFLSAGAKGVVISGRNKKRLDAAVSKLLNEVRPNELSSGVKRVLGVSSDVSSWEETRSLMKIAFDTYRQIDYVLANATGAERGSDPHAIPHNVFTKPNYDVSYHMIQSLANTVHAAAGYLAAPAGSARAIASIEEFMAQNQIVRRDKAIIVTGSQAGFVEYDLDPPYAVAKGAMDSYVWTNKSRLANLGIRINCITPAWVDTLALAQLITLGIVLPEHVVPMNTVTGAVMRFCNDSTISGVITSMPVPWPDVRTFDISAAPLSEQSKMVRIISSQICLAGYMLMDFFALIRLSGSFPSSLAP
ncbi:NAD(P)-binding protein [Clavulina sp. PMI_390]|nr:NAD(P)-binding protein [Clavulina sp. PMI_390]